VYEKKVFVRFDLCGTPGIRARIYTSGCRKIKEMNFSPNISAGELEIELSDSRGRVLSSGIYYIVMETLGKKEFGGGVKRILLAVVLKM
jgi:hypothetical protein